MNVLTVISAYPPSIGGAQLHHHMLNRHLSASGHDVHVATVWRTNRDDWLRGTTLASPQPRPDDRIDGIPVHNLGLERQAKIASARLAMSYYLAMKTVAPRLALLFAEQAEQVVKHVQPDVAHLSRIGREWFYEAFITVLEERGIPFVLTPYHHPHWHRRRDWWWWSIYRRAASINVFTDHERDQLIAGGISRSRIVRVPSGPVATPDGPVEPGPEATGPTVLFLGQVKPYKGLSVTYEAMRQVWSDRPDARLVVVGPWTRERRGLRRELEEDARVEVLGAVASERKWQELARCTVLCVPSTEESLGIVYLEAWQMGKPVVGATIPPVEELFERTGGGLAVAPEPSAVASALLEVIENPELAHEWGAAGSRAVEEEFNWEVAARRTQACYRAVLGRGS